MTNIEGLGGVKSVTYKRRCQGRWKTGKDGRKRWTCEHGQRPCRWAIVAYTGYTIDPKTGHPKPKQKWYSFRGTEEQVEAHRDELATTLRTNDFVEPSKLTVGSWLTRWLAERVKPTLRESTHHAYQAIVAKHLTPALGSITLQALRAGHVTQYCLERHGKLSRATLELHRTILTSALKSAMKDGLVSKNVASLAEGMPKKKERREDAKSHCWTPDEAAQFLKAADAAGTQLSALFALAIDSGARKGELLGLPWSAVNLDAGTVTVDRTLLATRERRTASNDKKRSEPQFGPTKTGAPRTVDISADTVERLRAHKRAQAELKMRNRVAYRDHNLVFAKEWDGVYDRHDSLGAPLQINNIGQREFAQVIKAAKVRVIKFHGLRHTSATMLLAAGEPVHVVAARLGHAAVGTTLETYAHALPSHGKQAARTIGSLLWAAQK